MTNKKGIAITGMLIAFIAVIVGIIAFFVSATMRWTFIGIGIIGLTLIYVIPSAMKGEFTRAKAGFILIIILIGIFIIFMPRIIPQVIIPTDNYVPMRASEGGNIIGCSTNQDCQDYLINIGESGTTRCREEKCEYYMDIPQVVMLK